jgi:hypothetical protein
VNTVARCPRTERACSEVICRERRWCRKMFERGLSNRGLPLKRKFRPRCCAKTRAGAPCIMRVVNHWRDADVVFLFDEFHQPRRVTIARAQGLISARRSCLRAPQTAIRSQQARRALIFVCDPPGNEPALCRDPLQFVHDLPQACLGIMSRID